MILKSNDAICYGWIKFHWGYIAHVLYHIFFCWWAGSISLLMWNKHKTRDISLVCWLRVFQLFTQEWYSLVICSFICKHWRSSILISMVYIPTAVDKSYDVPAGSRVFAICFLDNIYSDCWEIESQSIFNLHFPDD